MRNLREKMTHKLLLSFSLLACSWCFSASATTPIVIKFSHVVAENTPKGKMAKKFKALIEQRLPGKVKVNVFANGQLFSDNKVLEAILLDDVQMAAPSLSKFKRYTKKLQVFDLPFLFNDMSAVDRFQQSPTGVKLLSSMKKKGLIGLGYLHNGFKQLSASTKIIRPEDANRLKFRIMPSDVLAAQFQALGAIPIKKPFSEVFTLLQTKAIDGQENTWSNIYSKKFFEIQPYITESNHGLLDYMIVTSVSFWRNLPEDIRSEIQLALNEAIQIANQIAADKAISDKQKIIDSNASEIINLTKDEREKWLSAMQPVWKKFERQIGKQVIADAYQANSPVK